MKKPNYCKECKREKYFDLVCDSCGKSVWGSNDYIRVIIRDAEYHFCNYQCLFKFILEEIKKEQPKSSEGK